VARVGPSISCQLGVAAGAAGVIDATVAIATAIQIRRNMLSSLREVLTMYDTSEKARRCTQTCRIAEGVTR
jgi:hypothetical protein